MKLAFQTENAQRRMEAQNLGPADLAERCRDKHGVKIGGSRMRQVTNGERLPTLPEAFAIAAELGYAVTDLWEVAEDE